MSSDGTAATALAPGFRFHPTDEELVSYYLKRKVFGKPFRVDAISELDLYKSEPWDLPGRSRIQSRDMEWYFFSPLDKKYANRSRTSRTTGQGYWKTTGKDRAVRRGARVVGRKKTLVFHVGKAPKGQRTNWVMHEYRLEDEEIVKCGMSQDGYVVCRIFQKNGAGPQNGAQYGAPFVEEEWDEDEGVVHMRHGVEGITIDFGDNLFMQLDDLEHEDGHQGYGHWDFVGRCGARSMCIWGLVKLSVVLLTQNLMVLQGDHSITNFIEFPMHS